MVSASCSASYLWSSASRLESESLKPLFVSAALLLSEGPAGLLSEPGLPTAAEGFGAGDSFAAPGVGAMVDDLERACDVWPAWRGRAPVALFLAASSIILCQASISSQLERAVGWGMLPMAAGFAGAGAGLMGSSLSEPSESWLGFRLIMGGAAAGLGGAEAGPVCCDTWAAGLATALFIIVWTWFILWTWFSSVVIAGSLSPIPEALARLSKAAVAAAFWLLLDLRVALVSNADVPAAMEAQLGLVGLLSVFPLESGVVEANWPASWVASLLAAWLAPSGLLVVDFSWPSRSTRSF
mmetsp:Transcript_26979/g.48562  ORF Transcript_26979/g.48562 Transcript_26979/m.48562 type:complete len:297 (+) Transcript_26979:1700-2590(+)